MARGFCALMAAACAVWSPPAQAEEKEKETEEDYHTPIAGEEFHTIFGGGKVDVAKRDRRHVTAANFGLQWIPNGPTFYETLPFGALYVWHNWDDERRRFRGTFSGPVNDVMYNVGSREMGRWETIFTFNSMIIPLGRSEYVEGQRISDVDIEWSYMYAGVGIAYHEPLEAGGQDNALDMSLTYEPGFLWFKRTSDTGSNFRVPTDTYEGRVHFRLRVDSLQRNLMELPHRGTAWGGEVFYGQRAKWSEWGGGGFDAQDVSRERTYMAASGYAVIAGGVPFVRSERHRLLTSLYGGVGKDLDRFSAFRLPGRPTGFEWEALARPIMPGVAFNELFPRKYGIIDLIYRYEATFFLYPYIRATYGIVERPRFREDGTIKYQQDSLPAVGTGVISGGPWRSQIELNYSYNFGMFRDPGGSPSQGGHSFFIFWSKELGRCPTKFVTMSDC